MLVDKSVSAFVQDTASASPVPGGGSVSALAGALAGALCAMVARLTIEKERQDTNQPQLTRLRDQADALRGQLLQDVDRDAQAYQDFLAALRLPKSTPEEQQKRKTAIEMRKKEICEVPLRVARNALLVMKLAGRAMAQGRKDVITDSAVAVLLARSAARGALYNVAFNLSAVKDEAYVTRVRSEVKEMADEAEAAEKEALTDISF